MPLFQLVIALLFIGAVLSAIARRLTLPYPALLALAGVALALLPSAPTVELDPHLALALFVAPVLLDTAFDTSPRDLRHYWRPITSLALGAVIATVAAVAAIAHWLLPDISWPVAITLGAIVAPPDAAAAAAVLRQLRLPHRLVVILEGESLFNDASALLIYRFAVGAAVTGVFNGWRVVPTLLIATVGSIILAFVLSRVILASISKVQDVATSVIVQFLSTFAVWILAEDLGLSGIITMVVYAILIARRAPALMPARLRIPSYAVWEVAVFVLNVLAFILVGLQLRPIVEGLNEFSLMREGLAAVALCAVVIVVRILWVAAHRLIARSTPRRRADSAPTWRGAALVSWCGMRGIVTLAAALALPDTFPHYDFVLLTAFTVVLGTLVVQGLTLAPLIGALHLEDDGTIDREVWLARAESSRAALASLTSSDPAHCTSLRDEYEWRARHADTILSTGRHDPADDGIAEQRVTARRNAQIAQRQSLVDLRAKGEIGDDAFHQVEEELDWADLDLEGVGRQAQPQ